MSKPISEKIVASLLTPASGNKRHFFSGSTLAGRRAPSGFVVRVTRNGSKSFELSYRSNGRKHTDTIGTWAGNAAGGKYTVLQGVVAARARADELNRPGSDADARPRRTRTIEDGNKPAGETIADLLDEFVTRYIEKDAKLRTGATIKSAFARLVKPAIGHIGVYDLKRSHVMRMLDVVADENGLVQADRTLAYLRKAFHWRAARDDDFLLPIVRGMSRTKPTERSRDRILTDDEIRDLWKALDAVPRPSCYARYVKFVLHTATRRNEASDMRWDEIAGDVWVIPGSRYKNKRDHAVPVTSATRELIGERPKDITNHPFVFSTTDGELAFGGLSWAKRILEKKIAELRKADGREAMPAWTLHDLRRTARSLMSRAGVLSDHAERALGHTIGGVRGTYDRHTFLEEKRKAFEALDGLLDRILKPAKNVADLAARRKAGA